MAYEETAEIICPALCGRVQPGSVRLYASGSCSDSCSDNCNNRTCIDRPACDPGDIGSQSDTAAAAELLDENGTYDTKEEVALYLYQYGKLPSNFMTKKQARKKGWTSGALNRRIKGKCIGGDVYSNYEGNLPDVEGRIYYECDIGTLHARSRGSERIIYSSDGLIWYTPDHYETFELLYGEEP